MPTPLHKHRSFVRCGFTLLEVAVGLVILGFVVVFVLGLLSNSTKWSQEKSVPKSEPPTIRVEGYQPPPAGMTEAEAMVFLHRQWLERRNGSSHSLRPEPPPPPKLVLPKDAWQEHATDSKAIAPTWFKESFRPTPYISWLPFTDCSPFVRVVALMLALLLLYFVAMCIVTYPGALPNAPEQLDFGAWITRCVVRFGGLFLLLPLVLGVVALAFYWFLFLLCIAFVGEEYYVPAQFAAFLTVMLAMLSLVLVRFTPLLKLLHSHKFVLVLLGILGGTIEVIGLGFTIRDITQTVTEFFR